VTIGLQAVIAVSNAEDQRQQITAALARLDQAILTDPGTLMPIEQINRIARTFRFERVAEQPVVQLSSQMALTFRSRWQPLVEDDFEVLRVDTRFPVGGDTDAVQQVGAVFDIPQT
jgi:hypothetical protein